VNLGENLGGDVEDTDVDQDEGTSLILTDQLRLATKYSL
jgi:hypothetical protein